MTSRLERYLYDLGRAYKKLIDSGIKNFVYTGIEYIFTKLSRFPKSPFVINSHSDFVVNSNRIEKFPEKEVKKIRYNGHFREPPDRLKNVIGTYEVPNYHILEFEDAVITGSNSILVGRKQFTATSVGNLRNIKIKDYLFSLVTIYSRLRILDSLKYMLPGKRDFERSYESAFLLGTIEDRTTNPCTWRTETLPKLRQYQYYNNLTDKEIPLLFYGGLKNSQEPETLYFFDIEAEVIDINDSLVKVNSLITPRYPLRIRDGGFRTLSSDLKWVRKNITSGMNMEDSEFPNRVYISREDASARRVRNEEEVMSVLKDYSFTKYTMSELSIEQEIQLFGNANIIIGPHGANLAGIIFAKNAKLIELFPGDNAVQHYFVQCNELDLEYDCLLCTPAGEEQKDIHFRNMTVDIGKLEDLIEQSIT